MTTITFPPAAFQREIMFPCPADLIQGRPALKGGGLVSVYPLSQATRWCRAVVPAGMHEAELISARTSLPVASQPDYTRSCPPVGSDGRRTIEWNRLHPHNVREVWTRTYNATTSTLREPWMAPRTSFLRRTVTIDGPRTPESMEYMRWVRQYGYVGRVAGDRVPCYGPLRSNVRVDNLAPIAYHLTDGPHVGEFWPMTENWTGAGFGMDSGGPGGAWIESYPGLAFTDYPKWWLLLQRTEDRLSIQHRGRNGEPREVSPQPVVSERYSLDRNNDDLAFLPDGTEFTPDPALPSDIAAWHGRVGNHGWDQAHLIRQIRAALVMAYQAGCPAAIDSLRMTAMDAAYGYCPYEARSGPHGTNPYWMLGQSLASRQHHTKPPITIRGTGWSLFAIAAALDFGPSPYLETVSRGIRAYLEKIRLPCGLHQYGRNYEDGYAPPPVDYGGLPDERFAQSLEVPIVLAGIVAAELADEGVTRRTRACVTDTAIAYKSAGWRKWLIVEKGGAMRTAETVTGIGPSMNEPNAWLAHEFSKRYGFGLLVPPSPDPWTYAPNRAWCAGL